MAIKRVKSGVKGLDSLVQGGFPEGFLILVSGSPGTGKSILGLQFLCKNPAKEPGIYVTFSETRKSILTCGESLGLKSVSLEDNGKLVILEYFEIGNEDLPKEIKKLRNEIKRQKKKREKLERREAFTEDINILIKKYEDKLRELEEQMTKRKESISPMEREEKLFSKLNELVKETKAKRLVIDSLSGYMIYDGSKEALYNFIRKIKELGITTILISEASEERGGDIERIAEYLVDGLIKLDHVILAGGARRTLTVVKLRETKHDEIPQNFKITSKGIVIKPLKEEV